MRTVSITRVQFNKKAPPFRLGQSLQWKIFKKLHQLSTHFRLLNAIAVISDWVYNDTTGKYEPTDTLLNELSDVEYSDYIDLSSLTKEITITSTLPGTPTMTPSVSVLNCIGIEFYQQVGSNYYLFSGGNALRVDEVF